ncbi:MAG: glycine--tRNA ligase [Thermoprotei archaeon]|nr:MAG: glycine--tRNA ligase [Thermoprotei archaeon]
MLQALTLEDLTSFCVRRGFFFPSGRIYGGLRGFFDYGPLGAELRREILDDWWYYFVRRREDVVGIHGCIITHPRTWEASGHLESFFDYLVTCTRCGREFRADHLLEDAGVKVVELTASEISRLMKERGVRCPECGGELSEPVPFNLMFTTYVGPKKTRASEAYLRPETAQLIFLNFKDVYYASRLKLPFGIAQVGRVFRNEISPRNFLFRLREFEQMEIEYFVNPHKMDDCPIFEEVAGMEVQLLTAERQERRVDEPLRITLEEAWEEGLISCKWHAYWIGESLRWLERIGISLERVRVREHVKTELAHYAVQTFDVEYNFPFMGWKEIEGISNRGDYDLRRHQEYSGKDLAIEDDGEKVLPHVIEPSFGLERVILAALADAYTLIKGRPVLSLHPRIAPIKVAIFPIVNKPQFTKKAREIYRMVKEHYTAIYDDKGTIGKRYVKADEIGVPLAVTIDGKTLEDDTVTIRFRDTREQIRVHTTQLIQRIKEILGNWHNYTARKT